MNAVQPIWNQRLSDPRNMIGRAVLQDARRSKLVIAVRVGCNTTDYVTLRSF